LESESIRVVHPVQLLAEAIANESGEVPC